MTEGEFTAFLQICQLKLKYMSGWWLVRRGTETLGYLTEVDIDTAIHTGNWSPLAAQVRRMFQ